MAMVTRVYPDKKPEEVLLASARVFSLADDDYMVSHSPTAIHAQRNWLIYSYFCGDEDRHMDC